jgi:vancomycin permeability regulator SanA
MTGNILRPLPLQKVKNFIDDIERFEAERTLINPTQRDIDDYLFLHNSVVELLSLTDKINEVIATLNAVLELVDPPSP